MVRFFSKSSWSLYEIVLLFSWKHWFLKRLPHLKNERLKKMFFDKSFICTENCDAEDQWSWNSQVFSPRNLVGESVIPKRGLKLGTNLGIKANITFASKIVFKQLRFYISARQNNDTDNVIEVRELHPVDTHSVFCIYQYCLLPICWCGKG